MAYVRLQVNLPVFANYNDFALLTFHVLYFFNESLFFTPEEFILRKKVKWPKVTGVVNFDITLI